MEAQSKEPTSLADVMELGESEPETTEVAEEGATEGDAPEEEQPAEAEEPGTEDSEDAETSEEPAPDEAEESAEQPSAEEPPPTTRDTAPKAKPFAFSADGTEVQVPGAVVTEIPGEGDETIEMIVMPRTDWNRHVQPRLADRGAWYRKEQGLQKQLAQLNPDKNPTVVQAKALLEQMESVLALDEDSFADWVANYRVNAPMLKSEAEKAALRAQLDQRKAQDSEAERETKQREVVGTIERDIPLQVQAAMDRLGAKLPDKVKRDVIARLWNRAGHVYVQGWEGNPHGLQVGELRVRTEVVDDEIRFAAQLLREAGTRDQKAVAAEKRNQQAVGAVKKKAPPPTAVSAKGSPAPEGADKPYKNAGEFWSDMGINH